MYEYIKGIKPLDEKTINIASKYQDTLVKPPKSLGKLEDISIQIAGITGQVKNKLDKRIQFVFGSDNGVYEEKIASAPQNFTNLLLGYYANGAGCGINVLSKLAEADLKVIDIGTIGKIDSENIIDMKLMEGTNNFAKTEAMSSETAKKAIMIGIDQVKIAKEENYQIIGTGEVGIGNTSSSSACTMALLDLDPDRSVGRGAGLSDEAFELKKEVISKAVKMHSLDKNDPIDVLSKVGGLDIAAMVGLYIGAAYYRLPIIIDGFISATAALIAYKLNPLTKEYMIPSHISEEPGYKEIVDHMGLSPMLDLKMRLGEGTGCSLAMLLVDASLKVINEMLSFDESVLDEQTYKNNIG